MFIKSNFAAVKKFILIFSCFFLFKPIFPVLDYLVRYDYYVEILCENKEDEVLACNGKCYLAKELANASEEKNPLSSDKKSKSFEFEILFFEKIINHKFSIIQETDIENNFHYADLYSYQTANYLFHPPSLLVF